MSFNPHFGAGGNVWVYIEYAAPIVSRSDRSVQRSEARGEKEAKDARCIATSFDHFTLPATLHAAAARATGALLHSTVSLSYFDYLTDTASSSAMVTTGLDASWVPIYRVDNSILARIFEECIDETGRDLSPVIRLIMVRKSWSVSAMLI
jgi:hypothetical protein